MNRIVAFLDTNIFLHFQPFDQINWLNEMSSKEIYLAVAPIVIRELDHHKDQHSNSQIRKRAKESLKKIESLITGKGEIILNKNVEIIHIDEPKIAFEDYNLRSDINDDHLLACSIERKLLNFEEKVVIVTNDIGPRIKAFKNGIDHIELGENLRLPSIEGQIEKEKKELAEKISKLENSLPILSLCFKNGAEFLKFKVSNELELDKQKIEENIAKLKEEYPKLYSLENLRDVPQGLSIQLDQLRKAASRMNYFNQPSQEEYKRYNEELDKYYEQYEAYLYNLVEAKNQSIRRFKLEVVLFNKGTAPANDIDIFMHFPDGFRLFDEYKLPESIKPPVVPRKPMSTMEMIKFSSLNHHLTNYSSPIVSNLPSLNSNISSVNIKKTNSYDVEYSVKKLKQHLNAPCEVLYAYFENWEDISSFGIDYRINAANIPHEITGRLNIVFE